MNFGELKTLFDTGNYEMDRETFQVVLKSIGPFKKFKEDEDVPLEFIEQFIFQMTKRYMFKPQWITFAYSNKEGTYYSLAMIEQYHAKWLGTVYGRSIYELLVKFVLKTFYEIKKGSIRKRGNNVE